MLATATKPGKHISKAWMDFFISIGKWCSPLPLADQDPVPPQLDGRQQDRASIAIVVLELRGEGEVPSRYVADRDPVTLYGDLLLHILLDWPVNAWIRLDFGAEGAEE
jgi:hypothetical protein